MNIYDFLKQPILVYTIVIVFCFYVAWKAAKNEKQPSYKYYDKTLLFLLVFLIITRLCFLIFNPIDLTWNFLPIKYIDDIETGEGYYDLFTQLPWVLIRFWDSFYFLFASILGVFIYALIISKFKFGEIFNKSTDFAIKLSSVLVISFLIVSITNNGVGDLNVLNVVFLSILIIITAILIFSETFSSNIYIILWFVFCILLALFELKDNFSLETLLPYVLILLASMVLIFFRYLSELKTRRKDRKNTDIDLVKERANIARGGEYTQTKDFSLSYRKANMRTLETENIITKLRNLLRITKRSPSNDNPGK